MKVSWGFFYLLFNFVANDAANSTRTCANGGGFFALRHVCTASDVGEQTGGDDACCIALNGRGGVHGVLLQSEVDKLWVLNEQLDLNDAQACGLCAAALCGSADRCDANCPLSFGLSSTVNFNLESSP